MSRNVWIPAAKGAQIGVLALFIYLPWLQPVFDAIDLDPLDWAYLLLVTRGVVVAEELRKLIGRFRNAERSILIP